MRFSLGAKECVARSIVTVFTLGEAVASSEIRRLEYSFQNSLRGMPWATLRIGTLTFPIHLRMSLLLSFPQ